MRRSSRSNPQSCIFYAQGRCRSGSSCRFLHENGSQFFEEKRFVIPLVNDFDIDIEWDNGSQLPSRISELEMREYLVISDNESGRGKDLPLERRQIIGREGQLRGFTIYAAMSLRRQFLRKMTHGHSNIFYSLDMGNPSKANDHADKFERLVAAYLQEKEIPFLTEGDLRMAGSSHTPDFLLLSKSIRINNKRVRWIDCKTYYGSSALCTDKKLPIGKLIAQSERYNAAFATCPEETGVFLFLSGLSADLSSALFCEGNAPLLLNANPLDITGIYDEA